MTLDMRGGAERALINLHMGVEDHSQNNTYIADNGGMLNIHYGAIVNLSMPAKEELPPLPRCPAPSPYHIARRSIEDHIFSYFFGGGMVGKKCYVLHGLGGTGKTQAALAFINQYVYTVSNEQRRFFQAYWIDATSIRTIEESLREIALSVGAGSKAEDALVWLACRESDNANWIMLFNNADDPELDLTSYFPNCSHGNILITTRNRQAQRYGLGPGSDYSVAEMSVDESLDLLTRQARIFNPSPSVVRDATELVKELGYFALSISQAGAFIFTSLLTIQEYLEMFRTSREELLSGQDGMKNGIGYQYSSIQATLMISYTKLSPQAKRLLELFAFLHRENIKEKIFKNMCAGLEAYENRYQPFLSNDEMNAIVCMKSFREELLSNGRWTLGSFRKPMRELQSFSLVLFDPEQASCSIHPIIQEWIRSAHDPDRTLRQHTLILLGSSITSNNSQTTDALAFLRGLAAHVDSAIKGTRSAFDGCRNEFGLVYGCVGRWTDEVDLREGYRYACETKLGKDHTGTLRSMTSLALAYHYQGHLDEAATLHLQVLEVRKKQLTDGDPETLTCLNNLAVTYHSQGRLEDAAQLHSEVVEGRKKVLGPDDPDILLSANNLASVYHSQGSFDKAATLFAQVLDGWKERFGAIHPGTLIAMNNLAAVYRSQGLFTKAVALHTQIMETRKEQLGPEHPDTLTSMDNLAMTYSSQGLFAEAVLLLSEIVETRKGRLGSGHPSTLNSMGNLASTYRSQGRFGEAATLLLQILDTSKEKLGPEHPNTLSLMNILAVTYGSIGMLNEAATLHSQIMEARKERLGLDHPDTLISMNNLATIYHSQGRFDEAVILFLQARDAWRERLGAAHPNTLTLMGNLASAYHSQGRLDEAAVLQLQVVNHLKDGLGTGHYSTLNSMRNLSITYRSQQRFNEAAELLAQVMEVQKKQLGVTHSDTLLSMNALATIYGDQERLDEAAALQLQIVEAQQESLGPDDPNTLISTSNLALTYDAQGRLAEAAALLSRAVDAWKVKLGADHPHTLTTMNNLAWTYTNQGRMEEASSLHQQVLEGRKAKFGAEDPRTLTSLRYWITAIRDQGKLSQAEQLAHQAVSDHIQFLGEDHPDTQVAIELLVGITSRRKRQHFEQIRNRDVRFLLHILALALSIFFLRHVHALEHFQGL